MIIDQIVHWAHLFPEDQLACVADFLTRLGPEFADGEYPLAGEEIFARVMTYETRAPERARLESHTDYVDVQAVISGAEGIEWFLVEGLTIQTPYDPAADVAFYHRPGPAPARVDVTPGMFVVLFARDAHMPQLVVGDTPGLVKKVVVKVRASVMPQSAG